MDLIPQHHWLTSVKHLEGKRAIALAFSRLNIRRTARQPFFPHFFVNRRFIEEKPLREALSPEKRRFRVDRLENAFKVSASTFSDLNLLADSLFKETGFRPLVLEPERQFLLENNWGYFDCFSLFPGGEFVKEDELSVPEARLQFFSEPLNETLEQLVGESSGTAERIAESVFLSNTLKVPLPDLPHSLFRQQELLLENIFWKAGIGIHRSPEGNAGRGESKAMAFPGLSEIDFSLLWPMLLSRPFYNLGPDSLDCGCCRPKEAFEKNVLQSSLTLVEMMQDAFFFESGSKSFALKFHKENKGRESRVRRKEEFCLKEIPLGPFFRNQKVLLSLSDALKLEESKEARVVGIREMHWFCLKKESSLSIGIAGLNKRIAFLESSLENASKNALRENGIVGTALLSKNPNFLLLSAGLKACTRLLCSIPGHLCSEQSAFFSSGLRAGIESVEASVLESFGKFAAKRKGRVVAMQENKAFLRCEKPFSLIKQFSELERIPSLLRAKSG